MAMISTLCNSGNWTGAATQFEPVQLRHFHKHLSCRLAKLCDMHRAGPNPELNNLENVRNPKIRGQTNAVNFQIQSFNFFTQKFLNVTAISSFSLRLYLV